MPKKRSPESRRLLQALGSALVMAREKQGLTQERLGHRCGLDQTYVSGVERGARNPTLTSLQKLTEALGVSMASVLEAAEERLRGEAAERPRP